MMNDFAETRAFAKVNLTLDVLKKRADGYHELSTVMQTIDLYDELYADFSHEDIAVTADFDLPEGSVAYRAAHEYARRTGCGGAHIKIRAHIPEMAGLGGSSADGAGVLRLMQRRYGAMSGAELYSLAAELGSDVPFLLHGATALCRGRGERIEPLPDINLCYLIVKPAEGISTRQLFSALTPPYAKGRSEQAEAAIRAGDTDALAAAVSNGLAKAAEKELGSIAEIKRRLKSAGALAAEMSGSGSACFGIFETLAQAQRAAETFCDMAFCHACAGIGNAEQM